MVQRVLVQLVDDLTGESTDDVSTVRFGLDGAGYEIDLTEDNAKQFRATLVVYVESARRIDGRFDGEAAQIRMWAQENGFEISARGRISGQVVDAYFEERSARKKVDW